MFKNKAVLIILFTVILTGCATKTTMIDKENDKGSPVLSLDYRDFDQAIGEMVDDLLKSNALKRKGEPPYVVTTGKIINDTTQRIDTRQLMSSIEERLINSNQVTMTSAIGSAQDEMIDESRRLRDSDEFNQETIAKKGELIGPELSFSGKIYQRVVPYDKKTQQVEYYIQLIVTDLKTGLRFWQKQVQILKRGSVKAPIW